MDVEEGTPFHLQAVQYDRRGEEWVGDEIDPLAEVLCEFAHRFSAKKMDLGHCTTIQ